MLSNFVIPVKLSQTKPIKFLKKIRQNVFQFENMFTQEFSKNSLNDTKSEKTRESLFTFYLSSADLTSI